MAYQLIYTSAPRALEAGRSGFGTVARHREISPQLVSVLERVSQFSRLPGADVARVIFCHRIVTLAGGRFHLLSSIRDAGADYTGRTNHIAHHLVVSPREIAQLGQSCPSPARILSSMSWATSWDEPPRFLGPHEEISLAQMDSHPPASAWATLSGDPNQAWLLNAGEAARGAYLIHAAHTDLREVFHESLQLAPERLWQVSFTTSLQPSDEVSDFRWIGIEAHSPLRSQAENSGRAVLNLGEPHSLPRVEFVPVTPSHPAAALAGPDSLQSAAEPQEATLLQDSLRPPAPSQFSTPPQAATAHTLRDHTHSALTGGSVRPAPPQRRYAFPVLAGILLLVCALAVTNHLQKKSKQEFEESIDNELSLLKEHHPDVATQLKDEAQNKGTQSRDQAREIASKLREVFEAAYSKDVPKIKAELEDFKKFKTSLSSINFPVNGNKFIDSLESLLKKFEHLDEIQNSKDSAAEKLARVESLQTSLGDSENAYKTPPLDKLHSALAEKALKKRESIVLNLLLSEAKPSASSEDFQKKHFPSKQSSSASPESDQIKKILELWKSTETFLSKPSDPLPQIIEKAKSGETPPWLNIRIKECREAIAKQAPSVPAAPPTAPAPVAAEKVYLLHPDDWKIDTKIIIPELEKAILEVGSLKILKDGEPEKPLKYYNVNGTFFTSNLDVDQNDRYFDVEYKHNGASLRVLSKAYSNFKNNFEIIFSSPDGRNPKIGFRILVRLPDVTEKEESALVLGGDSPKIAQSLINLHQPNSLILFRDGKPFESSATKPNSLDIDKDIRAVEDDIKTTQKAINERQNDFNDKLKFCQSDFDSFKEKIHLLNSIEITVLSNVLSSQNPKIKLIPEIKPPIKPPIKPLIKPPILLPAPAQDSISAETRYLLLQLTDFMKNYHQQNDEFKKVLSSGTPNIREVINNMLRSYLVFVEASDELSKNRLAIEALNKKLAALHAFRAARGDAVLPVRYSIFLQSALRDGRNDPFKLVELYRITVPAPPRTPASPALQ